MNQYKSSYFNVLSVVKLLNCIKHDKIKFNSPPNIIFPDLTESSDNVMTVIQPLLINLLVKFNDLLTYMYLAQLTYLHQRDGKGTNTENTLQTHGPNWQDTALIVVIQAACYFSSKLGRISMKIQLELQTPSNLKSPPRLFKRSQVCMTQ